MTSVYVNDNGVDKTINLPRSEITFNNSNPASATQVTFGTGNVRDGGSGSHIEWYD